MRKKRELDKLSLDMIECEKAGYGCHYGAWKATQSPVKIEKKIPEGWLVCKNCGKAFKPKTKRKQLFCEVSCQKAAYEEKRKEQHAEYMRTYRERQKEG